MKKKFIVFKIDSEEEWNSIQKLLLEKYEWSAKLDYLKYEDYFNGIGLCVVKNSNWLYEKLYSITDDYYDDINFYVDFDLNEINDIGEFIKQQLEFLKFNLL